jgi:hypothetical protein
MALFLRLEVKGCAHRPLKKRAKVAFRHPLPLSQPVHVFTAGILLSLAQAGLIISGRDAEQRAC